MNDSTKHYLIVAWTIDFARVIWDMGWIRRIIFRILIGKYAYREFVGVLESLKYAYYYPDLGYGLKNCEYHKNKFPLDFHKANLDYYIERDKKNGHL